MIGRWWSWLFDVGASFCASIVVEAVDSNAIGTGGAKEEKQGVCVSEVQVPFFISICKELRTRAHETRTDLYSEGDTP